MTETVNKVSKETVIRTIILFLSIVNQLLTMLGKNPLPFADEDIYALLSTIATVAAAIWSWWKNNSFSKNAIEADKTLSLLKDVSATSQEVE